jgi:hypothetical protein
MTALQRRFKAAIERNGDLFAIGGNARRGLFILLASERAREFLSESEIAAATMPLRLAYVTFDDSAAVSETVVWNGQNLGVKRAVNLRAKGETVARILVLE